MKILQIDNIKIENTKNWKYQKLKILKLIIVKLKILKIENIKNWKY